MTHRELSTLNNSKNVADPTLASALAKRQNKTIAVVKRIKAVKIGKVCENKYKLNEGAIGRLPQMVPSPLRKNT